MLRMRIEARHGLRWGLLSLATAIALTAVSSDPADARTRRGKRTTTTTSSYSPGYAAIVVDANTGSILHSSNADAIRHPASLTKIMTLYMLFERLESGKLSLDSPLRVSEHAADQSPTKLGLREGGTITVEDAIKGMVTRSANDAAVVVAENLAGSEDEFARQMTRKARALGMSHTVYRNASGLPDSAQVTTARDQATLGRAIQERFPRYYRYFSTRSFTFRGQRIANHNRLLGRVEGVDGIKTGYIRASGFNLVTSVRRNGRHVVAVVLGGTSAGARDARMRQLLAQHVDSASTRRTAPMIAEAAVARRAGAARDRRTRANPIPIDLRWRAPATCRCASAAPRRPRVGRADPPGHGSHRFGEARHGERRQSRPPAPRAATGSARPLQRLRAERRRRRPAPASSACCRHGTASVSDAPPAPPPAQAAPVRETVPSREAARGTGRAVLAAADPLRLGHPGRRLPGRIRSPSADRPGQEQGIATAGLGQPLHRAGAARRYHPLSGPFRRARQRPGGSRLQIPQA